jgi:hypothetical protein
LDEQHGTPDTEDTSSTTDSSGWDQPPTFVEPAYTMPNPPEPDASTTLAQTTSQDTSDDLTDVDSQGLPSGAGDTTPPDREQASLVSGEPDGGSSTLDVPVTPMVAQDWVSASPDASLPSPVPLPYDQVPGMAAPPPAGYAPPPPPPFPGTPAGTYAPPPVSPSQPLYAPPLPPPFNPSQPLYAPPPPPPGAPAGYLPPPPGYGAYPPQPGVPMVVTGRPEPPSRTAAIIAEVILDLFGIYGVGWLIAGETTVGIMLLVGSFIWWPIVVVSTVITLGIGLICVVPLNIGFLLLSVILLSQRTAARPY